MKFFVSTFPLSLVFLSFSISIIPTIGKRGDGNPNLSGSMGHNDFYGRHLLYEGQDVIRNDAVQGYMTNAELEKSIKDFGWRCSNISRIYSIGESVEGIALWVMEISDKPGYEEAEPAFKFIANMHGDEPVGRELLMLLANWLCDNYKKDPLATLIIEKIHLHILPTMNPDGFSLRRRGNANNIDLNRDFPDQFFPGNNDIDSRQPETKSIMRWMKEIHFTASASLHGGALVANYPWDGSKDTTRDYYACPDDRTFRFLANVYSSSHYNMSLGNEFPGGITNGAAWYPIYGGMQDWNYLHGECFELTLEISDNKWPNASELPVLWEYNRMSMLNLVAILAKTGVHGRIFSADTGEPLPAFVTIKGINYTVSASSKFGNYHRLLSPGESYEVIAECAGYETKKTRIVLNDETVNVDFILNPEKEILSYKSKQSLCDCRCETMGKNEFLRFLGEIHLELSLSILFILGILCILLKRRMHFKLPHHRPTPGYRRPPLIV